MTTLAEAQHDLRQALLAGQIVDCPCCRQRCKIYKRKFNIEMALWIIWLVQQYEIHGEWIDVKGTRVRGGDYGKVVHWSLAVQCPNEDLKKRSSGLWKPTEKGEQFYRGEIQLPSHVHLYNNVAVDFSETMTTLQQALGEKFDYEELMEGGFQL